jgi:hypothetical protein
MIEDEDNDEDLLLDDDDDDSSAHLPLKKQRRCGVLEDENGRVILRHGFNDWGMKHPEFDKPSTMGAKIRWSGPEKKIIAQLISDCRKSSQPFVKLIELIKTKKKWRAEFHPHHIVGYRLREGERAVARDAREALKK